MRAIVIVLLCLSACGGDEFDDCAIGQLTGVWTLSYQETNGNCGPIPDEMAVLTPGEVDAACTVAYENISADMCRFEIDSTCPLLDGSGGTQQWVMALEHVDHDLLEGSGTVQINHPTLGTCRGTYDLTLSRS